MNAEARIIAEGVNFKPDQIHPAFIQEQAFSKLRKCVTERFNRMST